MSATLSPTSDFPLLEETAGTSSPRLQTAALIVQLVSDALTSGTEVHYLGTDSRLKELHNILELGQRALSMNQWPMPPIEAIARLGRAVIPGLVEDKGARLALLGMMTLPGPLGEKVVANGGSKAMLIVVNGVNGRCPDVRLGLAAMSAFCRRYSVALAIFP